MSWPDLRHLSYRRTPTGCADGTTWGELPKRIQFREQTDLTETLQSSHPTPIRSMKHQRRSFERVPIVRRHGPKDTATSLPQHREVIVTQRVTRITALCQENCARDSNAWWPDPVHRSRSFRVLFDSLLHFTLIGMLNSHVIPGAYSRAYRSWLLSSGWSRALDELVRNLNK